MMEVLEERPVSLPEVAVILKSKEKLYAKDEIELLYEQRRALDHAKKFSNISAKDSKEMITKLSSLDITIGAERVIKIIDLMPQNVDDIRAIFAKERFKYTEDEIKSIIDIVDQYR
jgi:DNA-directed RNA polymerase subunit F